jgi:hypothetical protein
MSRKEVKKRKIQGEIKNSNTIKEKKKLLRRHGR